MSDGMSDSRAEAKLYDDVRWAAADMRDAIQPDFGRRLDHGLVEKVNSLIRDLGWSFCLARYAEPQLLVGTFDVERSEKLWKAVVDLRRALRRLNDGHRGWRPVLDAELSYALTSTGYEIRRLCDD